ADPIAAQVETLLVASTFDKGAADRFARRDRYAEVADCLQHVAAVGGTLIPILLEAHSPLAPFRLALLFDVIPWNSHPARPYTIADLRASFTPEARLALIALGADRDWITIDQRGRAIFALRHIIKAVRRTT